MVKRNKKLKHARSHRKKTKHVASTHRDSLQQEVFQRAFTSHQAGHLSEAEVLYRQILQTEPNHPDALHHLGLLAYQVGKSKIAVELISKAINHRSDYVEAYNNLGNALRAQGNLDGAVASFRRALALKPDSSIFHNNLGNVLKDQGKLDEAIKNFRQAIVLNPDYADAFYNLGIALQLQNKLNEAATNYRRTLALQADYVNAYNNLGNILKAQGKLDEAIACFRQALTIKPDYAGAFKNLSAIVKYTKVDNTVKRMENLYNNRELSNIDRITLGFALGKVFEDLREYEKSFDFILAANLLKRKSFYYSIQKDHIYFKNIEKIFSIGFFSSHHGSGHKDKTPIFILGMPRSGTTLVEQILASHPLVVGAGELPTLPRLIKSICAGNEMADFPECMQQLDMNAFEQMGLDYVDKIREYSSDRKYIVDKLPHNFLHVGLIKTILPNAKVIHCARNPMDTCLSIFKTDFTGLHKYAYDMRELGQYYKLYRELMVHWEKVLPRFIYTIRYEEIVSDQQNQTKSLLDFCSLPWDESCLSFYKMERTVQTASFAQVRQRVYKNSVELWRQYEKQLEPLRKIISG